MLGSLWLTFNLVVPTSKARVYVYACIRVCACARVAFAKFLQCVCARGVCVCFEYVARVCAHVHVRALVRVLGACSVQCARAFVVRCACSRTYMHVFVCVCVYIYIYIYIYMHVCVHAYVCIYVYARASVRMLPCVCFLLYRHTAYNILF